MMTHRRFLLSCLTLLMAVILGCGTAFAAETTGEYMDDAGITAKVKSALLKTDNLKSTDISVETTKGSVLLTGTVPTQAEKEKVTEVTRGIKGVTEVRNELKLSK